ncbi:glycosyl hydrolase family 18 protein [Bacillus tianshenii]|nr:glycosyl hydrolase family 18 protein [Bacillus tianshenii]
MTIEERQRRKRPPRRNLLYAALLSMFLFTVTIILLLYPFPSKEQVPVFEAEHPILFDKGRYEQEAVLENGDVYVPFTFLQKHIDESITYDPISSSVIATTANKVLQYPNEALEYYLNEKPFPLQAPVVKAKDNEVYVAVKPFEALYGFKTLYKEETGAVIIQQNRETVLPAKVKSEQSKHNRRIRSQPTKTSAYKVELKSGASLTVQSEKENFYYVRTETGAQGYLPKQAVIILEPTEYTFENETEQAPLPKLEWPINMTWEAVYSKNPDPNKIEPMPGVNVISPTWFSLSDESGTVSNIASSAYAKWAKQNNYHLWALFSNDFNPELTHEVLSSFEKRQRVIRQLLEYSRTYQLDGMNVDFENVNLEDGPLVTQFMRELSARMHQSGLVVSMDVTFISGAANWSKFYEREKLANIVDYIVVMAYDEHWGTSPVSGSVASLPWVENNLKRLLEVVPHERVILGVPLYTRLWKEQTTENGNIEVSSEAYSMDGIQQWLKKNQITPSPDQKSGQNYAEYVNQKENVTYKVWMEDPYSLKQRGQLVLDYELAGVASWSRYFANQSAWEALQSSLKQKQPIKANQ